MSIIKMRGPIDVLFAFKIFSLPVPTRPGTRTFWQVPDPSRPEVKNPYPSDPAHDQEVEVTAANYHHDHCIEHDYKHIHHYDQGDHHHLHQDDLKDFLALLF